MQNGLLMCFWGIILGIVYLAMGLTGKNFFSAYMDFHPILEKKGFKYVCTTFLQSYDLSADGYTSDMYVYAVKGEPLTTLESFFSKPIDKYVELKAKPLPERKWWQVKKNQRGS